MSLTPEAIKTLSHVSTATITTVLLKKGLRKRLAARRRVRCGRDRSGWSGRPLRCASCPRGRIWPRRNHGRRRFRPGPRSKPCRRAASPWSTPWASPTPVSSAIFCARAWSSAGSCAGDRRRRARSRRRARHRFAGVVRRLCGPALGRRTDIRRLGRAGRLRRRRDLPGRHHRRRPGRCRGHSAKHFSTSFWPRVRSRSEWKPGSSNEVNSGAVLPGLYPMNAETKARYAASKK